MDELQLGLEEAFKGALANKTSGHEAVGSVAESVIGKVVSRAARALIRDLTRRAPEMLKRHRADEAAFIARNLRRWLKAFDLIEMIWVIAQEIGAAFNAHFRPQAVEASDHVFEALTHLHGKGLLVAAEAICLMKGGFADGALSRWRTLYELTVISKFIDDRGDDLALRYLAHAEIQAWKEAAADETADQDAEERTALKARAEAALTKFGAMKGDYGWASEALSIARPTFAHIAREIGVTDGRDLYRKASGHVHAGHRRPKDLLGMSETERPVMLVGASNSGMVGPMTLTALSLTELTMTLLLSKPNLDRLLFVDVLRRLSGKMHALALAIEERTFAAHKRKLQRAV